MAEMPPEAISGYVTGEGCFYAESGYDPKYRLRHRIRLAFCIEVKASDRELLEAVQRQLSCGHIYELDFGRYQGYETKNWKPHVKYRVSNFQELTQKVIPFFCKHPLFGTKRQSFEVFCQIAELMSNKLHLTSEGLEETKALVKQLNMLNKKGK
jgi:hypothetical protein